MTMIMMITIMTTMIMVVKKDMQGVMTTPGMWAWMCAVLD